MCLTKKHFKAIAEMIEKRTGRVIYKAFGDEVYDGYHIACELIYDLADYFQEQNPNFNRDKFLKACGVS
jgi:hypothetical protein